MKKYKELQSYKKLFSSFISKKKKITKKYKHKNGKKKTIKKFYKLKGG
jgi:hypothetical protein